MPTHEATFFLDFHCDGERIHVRSSAGGGSEQRTLRHVEEAGATLSAVKRHAEYISELFGSGSQRGQLSGNELARLKEKCQVLHDELIPPKTKASLIQSNCRTLILGVEDKLVGIPWEVLFDGKEFLALRYNLGRVVSTRQEFSAIQRPIAAPLKMLLLADPQGSLPSSYAEGLRLRDMLDTMADRIQTSFKASVIPVEYVKEKFRFFDMLHYAGHTYYNIADPGLSGFLLADGKLEAQAIKKLVGTETFPAFVFLNGCQSGHTGEWKIDAECEKVYGLANAFLLCGVRHYLGTFWEIQDEPSQLFALAFYEQLLQGAMIGEAVRTARVRLVEELGQENVIWASYMLYGDPALRYINPATGASAAQNGAFNAPSGQDGDVSPSPITRGLSTLPRALSPSWLVPTVLATGFLLLFLAFFVFKPVSPPLPPAAPQADVAAQGGLPATAGNTEQIDKLINELAQRFQREDIAPPAKAPSWNSTVLPLVFLDVAATNLSITEKQFVLGRITEDLRTDQRFQVVDRALLERLLQELKLSTSALADPATALKLGRILSAKIMATGSLLRENNDWMINLRLIDTETSAIVAAVSMLISATDLQTVANRVSMDMRGRIKIAYPLQGRILSLEGASATIDLGAAIGLREGCVFEILSEADEPIGSLKVAAVNRTTSRAAIISGSISTTPLPRIREIIGQ